MRRHSRRTRGAARALVFAAALAQTLTCASGAVLQSSASASAPPVAFPSVAYTSDPAGHASSSQDSSGSTSLLERIGRYLDSFFPDSGQWDGDSSSGGANGGLFGDGAALAWGGSTLEVVKTQASYLTRPAAFGPRIHSDDGLRGVLRPISDFYLSNGTVRDGPQLLKEYPDNHGCPVKGGPGWRDQDFDDDDREDGTRALRKGQLRFVANPPQDDTGSHNDTEKAKVPKNWIALVERGGACAFAAKVRVAQALGATAVVVGDAPSPEFEHDKPYKVGDPGLAGRLVTMFAPGDTTDIHIPSTFITRPSYVDLIRLIDEETKDAAEDCAQRRREGEACDEDDDDDDEIDTSRKRGVEVVLWRDDVMWEWPLIDLAFILLMLPSFMTLITIVVHRIRMARQRRKDRAPELAVTNLPCLIWRPNGQPWEKVEDVEAFRVKPKSKKAQKKQNAADAAGQSGVLGTSDSRQPDDMELGTQDEDATEAGPSSTPPKRTPFPPPAPPPEDAGRTYYSCDECAICLSEFVDGDRVRVLPCGHVFHLPEIDSWLLQVKKLCPICKRDITVPIPPSVPAPALAALEPLERRNSSTGSVSAPQPTRTVPAESEGTTESSPLLRRDAN